MIWSSADGPAPVRESIGRRTAAAALPTRPPGRFKSEAGRSRDARRISLQPYRRAARLEQGAADVYNVRISKCGGIALLLRIVEFARRNQIDFQLGCRPGETTGILSAAGRHLASRAPVFEFVEGSYDRHVLAEPITTPDVTFRYGGWAKAITGPGLGVRPITSARSAIDEKEPRLRL